jgi:hypothetical protein
MLIRRLWRRRVRNFMPTARTLVPTECKFFLASDALDCGANAHPLSGCITEWQIAFLLPPGSNLSECENQRSRKRISKIGSQQSQGDGCANSALDFGSALLKILWNLTFDNVKLSACCSPQKLIILKFLTRSYVCLTRKIL